MICGKLCFVAAWFVVLACFAAETFAVPTDYARFLRPEYTEQTNEGNEFFLGFFHNQFGRSDESARYVPVLFITTKESTPVSFNVTAQNSSIFFFNGIATAGSVTYVNTSFFFVVSEQTSANIADRFRGLRVIAEDGKKIIVFGQHEEEGSNDAYVGLPIVSLPPGRNHEFFTVSFDGGSSGDIQSVALIVGTEDNTTVTITPRRGALITHPLAPTARRFRNIPNYNNNVVINRYETVYLRVRTDISGTRIVASKPVSVFSGHECSNIPLLISGFSVVCDTLIEQIPPTDTWGTEVVTVPLITRVTGDLIKIISSQDSTTVDVTTAGSTNTYTLATAGNFQELTFNTSSYIQSDLPIAVFQFSRSSTVAVAAGAAINNIADPFMQIVSPCEQYRNCYGISTAPFEPSLRNTGPFGDRVAYVNYTNIVVPQEYFDVSQIVVNGAPVNDASIFQEVRDGNGQVWGYGAQIELDPGVQVIEHLDRDAVLGVNVYGFSFHMSYGYAGGIGLAPLNIAFVSFGATSYPVTEGSGPAQPILVLSRSLGQDVTVTVSAADNTAIAGADYGSAGSSSPQTYTVTFPAGSTQQTLNIPITDDNLGEPLEVFDLTLIDTEEAGSFNVVRGDPFEAEVEITDDDGDLSLLGCWYNELGSVMEIHSSTKGVLAGRYNTNVGHADYWYTLRGTYNKHGSTVAWAVTYNNVESGNSNSTCAWSGQIQLLNGMSVITTGWLLTEQTKPIDNWKSTIVNKDVFQKNFPRDPKLRASLQALIYAPKIIIKPSQSPYMVDVGDRLVLFCFAHGLTTPIIKWYANGSYTPSDPPQLHLVPTDTPHTTNYTCTGTNTVCGVPHATSTSIVVIVQAKKSCPPISKPASGTVFITPNGKTAVFICYSNQITTFLICIGGVWNPPPPKCP